MERGLSAGVVDGRNVWATDVDPRVGPAGSSGRCGRPRAAHHRTIVARLLHVPYSGRRASRGIDPELRPWLAFAEEKLDELTLLQAGSDCRTGRGATSCWLRLVGARPARAAARSGPTTPPSAPGRRPCGSDDYERPAPLGRARPRAQAERLALPELPTTTIGSFPQTAEIRDAPPAASVPASSSARRIRALPSRVRWAHVIDVQEELGLDVLVHGEPERNDMVEYFGRAPRRNSRSRSTDGCSRTAAAA